MEPLDHDLRVGTRGSPLALAQANLVVAGLARTGAADAGRAEVVVISTAGDRIQDRPLAEVGGKGLFTKAIEQALLDGAIDMAVHSMKDVPTVLPDGLEIACFLPREDPRDVLFGAPSIAALARGAVLGTSSLRRQAQVRNLRPDIAVKPLRGNVQTRLRKLAEGEADATLLAAAGLRRLGMEDSGGTTLAVEEMLPAVAQGAVGIEIRADDDAVRQRLSPLGDADTRIAVTCERALLAALDGSCRTPIAALAVIEGEALWLRGAVLTPDGSQRLRCRAAGRDGRCRGHRVRRRRGTAPGRRSGAVRGLAGLGRIVPSMRVLNTRPEMEAGGAGPALGGIGPYQYPPAPCWPSVRGRGRKSTWPGVQAIAMTSAAAVRAIAALDPARDLPVYGGRQGHRRRRLQPRLPARRGGWR